jgi:hypothetical protein
VAIPNDSYYLKRGTGFVRLWNGVKLNWLENDKDGYKTHMSCEDGIQAPELNANQFLFRWEAVKILLIN